MKFVWIFAFLPFCIGQVTDEECMNLVSGFTSIVNGSGLNVCSQYLTGEQQCCSQDNEVALGMTLNNAIRYNVSLGSDLRSLQDVLNDYLNPSLSNLRLSLINDVLRPLMNSSADVTVTSAEEFIGNLERLREEILNNINMTLQGSMDVNLTEEIARYFSEGISIFYYNVTFESPGAGFTISDSQMACAIDAIYSYLFPPTEQAKIASLGKNLQQIKVAYDVARAVNSSVQDILTTLENFTFSYTCTNVWTRQYGCPRCAGQSTPLCEGRCNEVLIGCMSSLQQVIVQLNVLLDFANASVNSLISGNPYDNINLNNVAGNYTSIFDTVITETGTIFLDSGIPEQCNIGKRKRSVHSSIVRHKRQRNIDFPSVTIDQSVVNHIQEAVLPRIMDVSLNSDRTALCDYLMANGSNTMCTVSVNNVTSYTSTFTDLEISEQVENPVGPFNLSQLRDQASQLPYVVTRLLMDRNDIVMLYGNVLPDREIPNLSFLNDTTTSTTMSPETDPTMSPGGGGAAAISFSLCITLVALLFATVL